MSAASPVERIAAAQPARLPGGPAWARRRAHALDALRARGLPDRRDENWKYLDHARIGAYAFDAVPAGRLDAGSLAGRIVDIPGALRIVLADGRFLPQLSGAGLPGLEVTDVAELIEREPDAALAALRAPGAEADDRWALLADAFGAGGALIRVAAGRELADPIHVVHAASAARPAVHQARLVVEAGAGSRFTLVEHFVALGDAAVLGNLAGELALGEDAAVTHLRLHQHGPAAAQVETWAVRQQARSRYAQHLLALGGGVLRSNLSLALEGPGAGCRLDGLFLADGERQVDLLTRVAHRAPATETLQDYRGIASGRGRGAFNGRIDVHPAAKGANASQTSRNLLLTPLAEINARPQLEIQVDDVKCRHGATIGSLDPEQLFYLVSRGLAPAAARALLTFAFCRDVVERLPLAPFRSAAESLVAARLADAGLAGGLD